MTISSAVLPGSGQWRDDAWWSGAVTGGAVALMLGRAIYFNVKAGGLREETEVPGDPSDETVIASDDLVPDQSGPLVPAYQGGLKMQSDQAVEQSAECKELSRQIKALKGKPLRKASVQEQYEVECLGREPTGVGGLQ